MLKLGASLSLVMAILAQPDAAVANEGSYQVSATVQVSQPGPVLAPEIQGQFMEQLGTGIDGGVWVGEHSPIPNTRGFRNDVVEALRGLNVPVVRWPGGCYADIYHWRDGIGDRQHRPVTLNRWWGGKEENNAFGTHEFFEFAEMIGAKTYLSLNVGTGSPAEAADWVEYITSSSGSRLARMRQANGRSEPWKIDYLGIGNEPWGCGGRMRASWYADLFRQYVGYVQPYNGDTVMVAAGPDAVNYDWTRTLMTQAAEHFDALSLHYYTLSTGDWAAKGPAVGFDEGQWFSAFAQTYRIEEMIVRHSALMDEVDPDRRVALAVDEWGAWYDPTPGSPGGFLQQQNTLRDALLAAVNLNVFHRHAERVRIANIAQMVNVLQAMILTDGPRMTLTPTYHAFHMFRGFQGATRLPLELEGPAHDSYRLIDGTAARGVDGRIRLALVNLDPNREAEVTVSFDEIRTGRVEAMLLTAATMDAHNTFDMPNAVLPIEFHDASMTDRRLHVRMPAKSLIVLTLD